MWSFAGMTGTSSMSPGTASSPTRRNKWSPRLALLPLERADRLLQVVFVLDDDGTVFVIHARPLTDLEKRRIEGGGND